SEAGSERFPKLAPRASEIARYPFRGCAAGYAKLHRSNPATSKTLLFCFVVRLANTASRVGQMFRIRQAQSTARGFHHRSKFGPEASVCDAASPLRSATCSFHRGFDARS